MKEEYVRILMKLAKKAAKRNEVPVSAIIIYNNKIIAKGYNKRHLQNSVLNHAEIIAIKKAAKKLKDWRLNNCDLYVTLKPCNMCTEIIKQSRISNVFYLLDKPSNKKEYNKTKFAEANNSMYIKEYSQYLSDFFQKKRDKNKQL
ncbi:MAG: nucleoside deaminase [Ruminococcus sp.]|nr:nucleoside deaminase [Ruminococcus sp.]